MHNPDVLESLAQRCEQASGGDRELDVLIGYAVDLKADDRHLQFRKSFDICGMETMLEMAESYQNIWRTELPRYTASLDSAMTLAPEGLHYVIKSMDAKGRAEARVGGWACEYRVCEGAAPTAALALCAAALRARKTLEASHD